MRIFVDSSRCTGHAMCAARAPQIYDLDELGCCAADGKFVPPDLQEVAREGAMACPELAIKLIE